MGLTIAQKIIKEHLISGEMVVGNEIALRIDQTLTQDATGTMAYLEFEAIGIPRVRTKLSVAYIDHNTLQSGFENADDHRYIQSVAKKFEDVKVTASTFKKVFKDSMDSANAGVKNLIENFNETERSAQKLLNTIGGRLSNLGLNPQELAQYSTELARIAQELTAAGLGSGLQ